MNNRHLKESLILHLNENVSITIKGKIDGKKDYSRTIIGMLEKVDYKAGYGIISSVEFDLSDITEIRTRLN